MSRRRKAGRKRSQVDEESRAAAAARAKSRRSLWRWVGLSAVVATFLVGGWIYYPRDARPLVPGIGVAANCATPLKPRMSLQLVDASTYLAFLTFGAVDMSACRRLVLVSPPGLLSAKRVKSAPLAQLDGDPGTRTPLPVAETTENAFHQTRLEVDLGAIGSTPLAVELAIEGAVPVSFDRTRLLLPKDFSAPEGASRLAAAPIAVDSILVPASLDLLQVRPDNARRSRQLGAELLTFGGTELSEIDLLLSSRTRAQWKTVYITVAFAIALSVVAGVITSYVQKS